MESRLRGIKEDIRRILREGQEKEGGRKGRGWDEVCREGKREVRRELRRWRKLGGGVERYRKVGTYNKRDV